MNKIMQFLVCPNHKAKEFCQRAEDGGQPPVLWVVHLDPVNGCAHVNYVAATECPGEEEFLFAPYSVFTVQSVLWQDRPDWVDCHVVHVKAAPDNKRELETLPLAPWA